MTTFVPVVLTAEQAKAAANACAAVLTSLPFLAVDVLDHPLYQAAIAIEDAMVKEGVIDPLPRQARNS